jgi:hypothetical protein
MIIIPLSVLTRYELKLKHGPSEVCNPKNISETLDYRSRVGCNQESGKQLEGHFRHAVYETACWSIVGPKLERLTLTDAGDPDAANWVGGLVRKWRIPALSKVELYYGVRVLPALQRFRARMSRSGIECKCYPSLPSARLN